MERREGGKQWRRKVAGERQIWMPEVSGWRARPFPLWPEPSQGILYWFTGILGLEFDFILIFYS